MDNSPQPEKNSFLANILDAIKADQENPHLLMHAVPHLFFEGKLDAAIKARMSAARLTGYPYPLAAVSDFERLLDDEQKTYGLVREWWDRPKIKSLLHEMHLRCEELSKDPKNLSLSIGPLVPFRKKYARTRFETMRRADRLLDGLIAHDEINKGLSLELFDDFHAFMGRFHKGRKVEQETQALTHLMNVDHRAFGHAMLRFYYRGMESEPERKQG